MASGLRLQTERKKVEQEGRTEQGLSKVAGAAPRAGLEPKSQAGSSDQKSGRLRSWALEGSQDGRMSTEGDRGGRQ